MAKNRLLQLLVLVLVVASKSSFVSGLEWDKDWSAIVTGSVFCDQCLKHEVFPFGLPMNGAKVSIQCYGANGANVVMSSEATTDFLGGYVATIKGVSDLGGCKAVVTASADSSCNLVDGGAQALVLKTKFFFNAFYVVDPLFYMPAKPKDFCPGQPHPMPPPFTFPPLPKPPNFPPWPPISLPPFPWKTPSTCAFGEWLNTGFFCYWKNATPFQTTVGQMFGKAAQKKYGNMSVYTALQSGDELLREGVAAMMNAYTNAHFYMSPKAIKKEFNSGLSGNRQEQANVAWKFQQANSGYGKGKCMLSPCH